MNGLEHSHKKIKIKYPKSSIQEPIIKKPKSKKTPEITEITLEFLEEERKTVFAILNILLESKEKEKEECKKACAKAIEQLFTLVYNKRIAGKVESTTPVHPIVAEASRRFGITVDDIIGTKKHVNVMKARRWIVKSLRKEHMSYAKISRIIHRTEPTTRRLDGK